MIVKLLLLHYVCVIMLLNLTINTINNINIPALCDSAIQLRLGGGQFVTEKEKKEKEKKKKKKKKGKTSILGWI